MTFTIQSVGYPPDMSTITTTTGGAIAVKGEVARYSGTSATFTGLQSKKHYKGFIGGNMTTSTGTGRLQLNDTPWSDVVYHTLHSTTPTAGVGKTTLSMSENANDPIFWEFDIPVCANYTVCTGTAMYRAITGTYLYAYRFNAWWNSAIAITKIELTPTAGTITATDTLLIESDT